MLGGRCGPGRGSGAVSKQASSGEIDVARFGFRPSSANNAEAQDVMRGHAIANPGSVYRFQAGHQYDLTTARFLFGVRSIEIIAHGASFKNVNAGTFGYADLNAAFYVGPGSVFHPMGGGNLDVTRATSGDLARDAAAGEISLTLLAPHLHGSARATFADGVASRLPRLTVSLTTL